MPTSGNTLGVRRYYKYTSDSGVEYKYQTDETLGAAMGAELNDQLPYPPQRFKLRRVLMEATVAGQTVKKRVVAPLPTTPSYAAVNSTVVTIDGINYQTTGKVGESASLGRNPAGVTPP